MKGLNIDYDDINLLYMIIICVYLKRRFGSNEFRGDVKLSSYWK